MSNHPLPRPGPFATPNLSAIPKQFPQTQPPAPPAPQPEAPQQTPGRNNRKGMRAKTINKLTLEQTFALHQFLKDHWPRYERDKATAPQIAKEAAEHFQYLVTEHNIGPIVKAMGKKLHMQRMREPSELKARLDKLEARFNALLAQLGNDEI